MPHVEGARGRQRPGRVGTRRPGLRLEGHTVVAARDGETALALVEYAAPDVVVLDYRMPPGPTGLAIAAELRASRPDLRLVLYTNYRDAELIRATRELGVEFLPKGNLRRLRHAVRRTTSD